MVLAQVLGTWGQSSAPHGPSLGRFRHLFFLSGSREGRPDLLRRECGNGGVPHRRHTELSWVGL